ncbi:MAG: hypothetical protein QOK42_1521 [Frankiaceae bacterium]|nr:hypothetical protein [Frankiaceae bacterium]MDX6226445.1 hypothetical protein [Frankiales bacterium]
MGPDEWPPVAVVVPDDIRELDADVAAYHRDLRRSARRTRWGPVLLSPRWGRAGVSGPMLILAVVTAAFVGSLMALFPPAAPHLAKSAPLAAPALAPGRVGALLPDVRLEITGTRLPARQLRPALILTVPPGCNCSALIRSLVTQTAQYSVQLVLVTHGLSADGERQVRNASLGRADLAIDSSGSLQATYGSEALVFVRADGVVLKIVPSPTAQARYELPLSQLAIATSSG